ncbi:MAG TPA: DUF1800 family protein [Hyphomonadaceae bacterium]
MSRLQGAIAATRFGLGARPGEIDAASSDPRGWLKAQVRPDAAVIPAGNLLSVKQVFEARIDAYQDMGPRGRPPGAPGQGPGQGNVTDEALRMVRQQVQRETRDGLAEEIDARSRHAASTPNSFAERWLRFWANHFTVAARNAQTIGLVGPFEREAIRPHVFGNFQTLLGAASFHPGMLVYLDATRSIGPSTQAAQRRDAGLNENLAREILELHTMGVGSGYSQQDIIEFAKALTGWTIGTPQLARLAGLGGGQGRQAQRAIRAAAQEMQQAVGETVFVEQLHEPGARTVLGKSYGGQAKQQAAAILDDIALHPATARHIATKLVRHFVADQPPPAAVAKIEAVWKKSNGHLGQVARAVVDLDEAWGEQSRKFKTPEELLVSASRAAGAEAAFGRDQRAVYTSLAQRPFSAPSPAGWPDDTASWSGADAIKKRLEWANAVSRRMVRAESPTEFLDQALGPLAGARTRQAVARAESAEQGFTLALMSPEFQRR